jgi:ABC-type polysaccharide/polyol phosphate transport system ATPase subunit
MKGNDTDTKNKPCSYSVFSGCFESGLLEFIAFLSTLKKSTAVGVSLTGLTKIYHESSRKKKKVAVDHLTMDFHVGEVTCLLGHNGAGKSTAM